MPAAPAARGATVGTHLPPAGRGAPKDLGGQGGGCGRRMGGAEGPSPAPLPGACLHFAIYFLGGCGFSWSVALSSPWGSQVWASPCRWEPPGGYFGDPQGEGAQEVARGTRERVQGAQRLPLWGQPTPRRARARRGVRCARARARARTGTPWPGRVWGCSCCCVCGWPHPPPPHSPPVLCTQLQLGGWVGVGGVRVAAWRGEGAASVELGGLLLRTETTRWWCGCFVGFFSFFFFFPFFLFVVSCRD